MTFEQILDRFRKYSFSERDKGARFENLMKAFMKTAPMFADDIKEVWTWSEFPFRKDLGSNDLGIDLVVKTIDGEYWAVQCKCYAEDAIIDKPAVDSFLSTSGRSFVDEKGQTQRFTRRIWFSTTDNWNTNANETIQNQDPPVTRIGLADLIEAPVDWDSLIEGKSGKVAVINEKKPRPHQQEAIDKAHEYFKTHDRGKYIAACGTGKTYTSLKIVEQETGMNGFALFLVPSIALLGQTLREWINDTEGKIYPVCICSDSKSSQLRENDTADMSTVDLPYPATTNVEYAVRQVRERFRQQKKNGGMVIIFSTYQSIDVVSAVQQRLIGYSGNPGSSVLKGKIPKNIQLQLPIEESQVAGNSISDFIFDIIVCDEAHRTTGVTLKGKEESDFVKVHDNDFLRATRRLYMTATPRLYTEDAKKKALQGYATLCSMDDESYYGEEICRLGFGKAVEKGLLSDYKVIVLTISEDEIPPALQAAIANKDTEIDTDDASKLIGTINALSKRMTIDSIDLKTEDPNPMHTALAFCSSIKNSQQIKNIFNQYSEDYYDSLTSEQRQEVVHVSADHVDGGMDALKRQDKLTWLKRATNTEKECHILSNVRCMSEGVDVPALDAVIFLSARNSQVDVVQSVGRVMRRAPKGSGYDKRYGYIIIPVVIPTNVEPEEALDKSKDFSIVWSVLNALRAHDDRFNATVNKIELNKKKPTNILIGKIPKPGKGGNGGDDGDDGDEDVYQGTLYFTELQGAIYARMVKKVGTRRYWTEWAKDIANIAQRHKNRITQLIHDNGKHQKAFEDYLNGLHKNINPSITEDDALDMLSQHLITQPVFEALFDDYSFVKNNPISRAMNKILALLEDEAFEKDHDTMERFYADVRNACEGIDNAEGKQKIVIDLYDKFFKLALPITVEKLGIVYTPVEVVDFILKSVDSILNKEFHRHLTDENVHILDPFTGTGTFMVRLLQLGLIKPEDLVRKYNRELHANEIVLMAYYIASINIENAYHDLAEQDRYRTFGGICLTDTFQLGEMKTYDTIGDGSGDDTFPINSSRVMDQKRTSIRIIVANPPYSVGQKSANDNAQNESYPNLEQRLAETYVAGTKATLKNSLYDSYIKAFRWASDRLDKENGGIIGFVTNAGWLDGVAMDGMRACLEREFTSIYVFNLRGNQRTSGETSRREGGKIFGSGSRTPIAITVLVRNPKMAGKRAEIFYHDIGDYLSREDKLKIINKFGSVANNRMNWQVLRPNKQNDWLNQRSEVFTNLIPLGDKNSKKSETVFTAFYSNGLKTNRDAWVYNFSASQLTDNMGRMIDFYNNELKIIKEVSPKTMKDYISHDETKINWTVNLLRDAKKNIPANLGDGKVIDSLYRPFCYQKLYHNIQFIERPGKFALFYPDFAGNNLLICVPGLGGHHPMSSFITDHVIDLGSLSGVQCFPLNYYVEKTNNDISLFDDQKAKYVRHDGITDFALQEAQELYGKKVSKEDIFFYVYGFLHLPKYRQQFASDLKKSLPRILFVDEPKQFWQISKAGRDLADLHLNYENQPAPEGVIVEGDNGDYTITKLRYPKKGQRDTILYNQEITIKNVPERCYDYVVNGRSPIEWIFDRYQVTIDKKSGIKNDPNDWAKEHNQPRYILDLLLSVMTVSLKTLDIIESLPDIKFE